MLGTCERNAEKEGALMAAREVFLRAARPVAGGAPVALATVTVGEAAPLES